MPVREESKPAGGGGSGSKQTASAGGGGGATQTSQPALGGGGGGIAVAHTRRTMKAYNFTESDLDTISVTNVVSGVAFAIAAGIITFCIDINKDIVFAGDVIPPAAQALRVTVNWIGIPIALLSLVAGVVAQIKRGSVISRVKRESENVGP